MYTFTKNIIFWLIMALTALLIWAVVKSSTGQPILTLTFTQFSREIAADNVRAVTIAGSETAGIFRVRGVLKKENSAFETAAPENYSAWIKVLTEKDVSITFDVSEHNLWLGWLANLLPTILIVGLWIYFIRVMKKGWQGKLQPPAGAENP